MASRLPPAQAALARQARELLVGELEAALPPLAEAIRAELLAQVNAAASSREMQQRRDAWLEFERASPGWVEGAGRALRRAIEPPTATARNPLDGLSLELIGDDVVENKILASRLALAVQERAVWELNDLKLRITHLEGGDDLASEDVVRPEAWCQLLVEQWTAAKLPRSSWQAVRGLLLQHLVERAQRAYQAMNASLMHAGVLPEIDLSTRVKRPPGTRTPAAAGGAGADLATPPERGPALGGRGGPAGDHGAGQAHGGGDGADGEPAASGSPLARARARAGGVVHQLRRLLAERIGEPPAQAAGGGRTSARLAAAMAAHASQVQTHVQTHVQTQVQTRAGGATVGAGDFAFVDNAAVQQVALDLRHRSVQLKHEAETSGEKATIEIVALMFQSILAEERIPPVVRVWFARLQMPVLRVALAEPEFFGTLEHPARQLIDRMGSCVLGFDGAAIQGSALEAEIRRVVQVIEQYPETGRRVFQLVYEEFQRFLARFLTEAGHAQKLVSVAQQVEQKETMAVQYTIELRKMLADLPVREEIRDFLFKVWAEVLAVAGVKHGPRHEETLALKKSAGDLVWAAGAKPNRTERAKVIQDLPELLVRLRRGMTLLGLDAAQQERHIKVIGDTLADAFMSRTEAIPQAQIEEITRRLANLEEFLSEDDPGELPLDKESIELMLGIDATLIEVISTGGSQPGDAMLAWAKELQPGTWYSLDHNGRIAQVQYAWRSERGQLHLLAARDGRSYLVQLRRLAAYLQAGLLVPTEEEALTVRATREALAKLDANPERLLQ